MGFMDAYKRLEKLCGEVMGDDRRISAYIDEMINTPRGASQVRGWNEDLKRLKHYRWVRNKIVHETGCSEENMCDPEDACWLEDFYARIMNQTDPLALYRKATQNHAGALQSYRHTAKPLPARNDLQRRSGGCLMPFVLSVLICTVIAALIMM